MTLSPGAKVRLIGIKTPGLNGLQGKVLAFDKSSCRWRVDLGESHGVKALKEENLIPLGGSENSVKPGDLISSLLGKDDDSNSEDSNDMASDKDETISEPWKPGDADHKRMEEETNLRETADVENKSSKQPSDAQADVSADHQKADAERSADDKTDGGAASNLDEQDELSKLTVKELKLRLTALNVSILGVTEKSELIALVRKHPSAASLGSTDGSRAKAGAPNTDPNVSTKYAQPGKPWEVSGSQAQPAKAPAASPATSPYVNTRPPGFGYGSMPPFGYGPPPGWGHPAWNGYQRPPPFYPPGFMPYGAPPGFLPGQVPGHFPYGPPPTHAPLMPRAKALERAEERMQQHPRQLLDGINNFVRDLKVSFDFEMGLRILSPQILQHILSLKLPVGSAEAVLQEIRRADPEAEAIVRSLLQKEASRSSSPSSRGRGRRKSKRKKKGKHKESKRYRSRSRRAEDAGQDEPGGVWELPEEADTRGAEEAGMREEVLGEDDGKWPAGSREQQLQEWLEQLDGGRGILLQYFESLRQEFSADLSLIRDMRLATPRSNGILGTIDAQLWERCGIRQMGHRLLLAKGINALE